MCPRPFPSEPGPDGSGRLEWDRWTQLAEGALQGRRLTAEDGLSVLQSGDEELLALLSAVYRVRHRWFGNRVKLNYLINAKCGLCAEDCGYCSQSRVSEAQVAKYPLVDPQRILAGADEAAQRRAKTYCIVISGRSPDDRELETIARIVPQIKARHDLRICVSPGLLDLDQAARLKDCGVDRVNHNLNTSRRFYPQICTTHTYQDRLNTLQAVRAAGMEICSGGIVGMGEEEADVVDLALQLGDLRAEAVPINFLLPIPGIAIEKRAPLNPRYCLKVLALFRLSNPQGELRIAAGREVHLRSLQPLGLYAADSIFVSDYLTTQGQPAEDDFRMIEDLGFEIVGE
jgi:biotin synthase